MVNISGKMVIDMKDGSHKTFQMVRDHYFTQMDKYTQANGNKTKNMEKEQWKIKMESFLNKGIG